MRSPIKHFEKRLETRFWPYCSNNVFIDIIEQTIYKQITYQNNTIDCFEKIITQQMEGFTEHEYEAFTHTKDRQKSRQNQIGFFHQYILGSCDGWKSSNIGVDLYNEKRQT